MPVRCALGCEGRGIHCFPNPEKFPEQFRAWMQLMGRKLETPQDFTQYRHKRICDIHFTEKDRNRNNRLNALAVPSQYLPAWCVSPLSPQPTSSNAVITPSSNLASLLETVDIAKPSTSFAPNEATVLISEETVSSSLLIQNKSPAEHRANTSIAATTGFVIPASMSRDGATSYVTSKTAVGRYINIEHSYCLKPKATKICRQPRIPTLEISKMKITTRQINNLKREILRLRKRGLSFKSRLQNATRISDDIAFKQVTRRMSEPAKLFTYMNFRESGKKSKGRRFTIEEKILSLSIFKKSPKCYTLLSKYFTLPSKKSLKILLSSVEIKPGINRIIFNKIKKAVCRMNVEDTLCTLIFDEMSITPQVHYNAAKDELKGLTTIGINKLCDHALVFMVKGIKANYKQPVAYYFTNSLNKQDLKSIIVDIVKNVHATGLQIIATVCDQSTVNVSAINSLVSDTKANCLRKGLEWRHEHFKIDQKIIYPVYDCPYLLKGLRNNLLTKDLIYSDENNENEKKVKWSYFEMVYAADESHGELRCAPRLPEEHVNIKKMKVKLAAQVFSHSVAVATDNLNARGDLPQECRDLIPFVLLIDKLFDSLNSSTYDIRCGKIYKAAVKKNSPHHELWKKSIKIFKTIKFISKKVNSGKVRFIETTVPSVTNFIKTIEAMQVIWKKLNAKYSFNALLTRNLNQDPLENFFGNIRSYGGRNVAPNCISFEGAFKALLLNNYSVPHSIQANCEEDNNYSLQDLKFFLTEKSNNTPKEIEHDALININEDIINSFNDTANEDKGQRNYVCGWVVTKCLKNVCKNCNVCKNDLLDCDGANSASSSLIRLKEYNKNKKWLCYPSKSAKSIFQIVQTATCAFIKRDVPKYGLKQQIKLLIDTIITTNPFKCSKHDLKNYFVNVSIDLFIRSWSRSINRILAGAITYNGDDELKLAAQTYYNKHKKINISSTIFMDYNSKPCFQIRHFI